MNRIGAVQSFVRLGYCRLIIFNALIGWNTVNTVKGLVTTLISYQAGID